MIKIILSIIPGIIYCLLFYFLEKNRKDLKILLLLTTFIMGFISGYLSYRLEWHFGSYFKDIEKCNLFEVFFYAIFGVAIFEEGLKLLFTFIFTRIGKVNTLFSTIVYTVFTASGFFTFENLLKPGVNTIISRMITSIPSHICFAIIMGLLLYNVKEIKIKSIIYLILAFIIPVLLHAFYNTFLYQGNVYLYKYCYIYLIILIIVCIYIVIKSRVYDYKDLT